MRGAEKIAAALVLLVLVAASAVVWQSVKGGGKEATIAEGGGDRVDFHLPDAGGNVVTLGRFAGKKPVLLVFWATWCPHCNAAVPEINRLYTEPPTREKLAILALDFMESREKVTAFIEKRKVAYPVLLDSSGSVARKFQVAGIPTYILIDREGRIVFRDHNLPGDITRYLE